MRGPREGVGCMGGIFLNVAVEVAGRAPSPAAEDLSVQVRAVS